MTEVLPILSASEQWVYSLLTEVAEVGGPCPLNVDIEVALGYESCGMGSWIINRLEMKGLIVVTRYQRYREVKIVKTGKTTAPYPSVGGRKHVPKVGTEQQERFVTEWLKLLPQAAEAAGYSGQTNPRNVLKTRAVMDLLARRLASPEIPRGIRSRGPAPTERKPSKTRTKHG